MSRFHEVINDEKPVLVDFYAEWCGPCKVMAPELKKLADMHKDNLRVIKVDIDKNQQAVNAYRISGVPTLMLFKKGEILWRQSGAMSAQQISASIIAKLMP
ncbi:MAG: thioredoxin [Chitinophagaceae bacterium]|nr:thioredoxin [Chitinophagaceae bacterium]